MYITDTIEEGTELKVLPTMNAKIGNCNTAWVGTFQLIWNDFMENISKGEVQFVDGNSSTVDNLNRQEFTKNDISENAYYIKNGIVCPELKEEILKGIKNKFKEESNVLDQVDFTYNPLNVLFYAMLKKNFKFLEKFDNLDDDTFGFDEDNLLENEDDLLINDDDLVEYFGIDSDSEEKLYKNVSVLFYSKDDYAVKLHTKTNDEVILYRTDDIKSFDECFIDVKNKAESYKGEKSFSSDDYLKVPKIDFSVTTSFPDVENKVIKNTDGAKITKTLEIIKFKMDECGVKLKSEAFLHVSCEGAPQEDNRRRYFEFDKPFVMFLKERDKQVPYFAMYVVDVKELQQNI